MENTFDEVTKKLTWWQKHPDIAANYSRQYYHKKLNEDPVAFRAKLCERTRLRRERLKLEEEGLIELLIIPKGRPKKKVEVEVEIEQDKPTLKPTPKPIGRPRKY